MSTEQGWSESPDGDYYAVVHFRCPEISEYNLISHAIYKDKLIDGRVSIDWSREWMEELHANIGDWLKVVPDADPA